MPDRESDFRTPRAWWLVAILASAIALYGWRYVLLGEKAYEPNLAESFLASSPGIFIHTLFGPMALLSGVVQFLPAMRKPGRWPVHRVAGRVYVVASILLASVGLYLSRYSFGGIVTHVGFGLLAIATLYTTIKGFLLIRDGHVKAHREWMLRSYSLIFGAVTLRIWIPLLMMATHGDFTPAYRIVAFLAWVPNLLLAEWLIRRGWRPHFRMDPDSSKLRNDSLP